MRHKIENSVCAKTSQIKSGKSGHACRLKRKDEFHPLQKSPFVTCLAVTNLFQDEVIYIDNTRRRTSIIPMDNMTDIRYYVP